MTTITTYGEVDWQTDVFGGDNRKNTNSKDLFLRLDEGSNEMRLVTQPFQYLVHKIKKNPNDVKDFGQKVSCSMVNGSCPACEMSDESSRKTKPRWLLGVISRKTGTYKILDISFAVFSQIRKYAKNKKFGDPTKYDINIEVDKNGGATGYYSVQALPKEPLSAADQVIKDNADLDDLKRRVTPLTPENVQKRLDRIMGVADVDGSSSASKNTKTTTAKTTSTPIVSMTDDEALEDAFPSYEGTTA